MKINTISPNVTVKKQPSFTSMERLGGYLTKTGSGLAKKFEANGYNMSPLALAILLFGATIIPRYVQAYDKHDRREILLRDTLSISALLYLSASLNKGFSKAMSKLSGFALSFKPKENGVAKKFGNSLSKAWGYLNPLKGVDVMTNEQIVAKYSNIKEMKDGILGFTRFIQKEGGDIRKVLSTTPEIKAIADKIVGNKDITTLSIKDVMKAFKKAKETSSPDLESLYTALKGADNALVKKAQFRNNMFGFFSTFVLTPVFMIWLQHFNEKLTKKIVAKEAAEKKALESVKAQDNKVQSAKTSSVGNTVKVAEKKTAAKV